MKTIRVVKEGSFSEMEIKRVSNKEAERAVVSGIAEYVPKSVWKKEVRDVKLIIEEKK